MAKWTTATGFVGDSKKESPAPGHIGSHGANSAANYATNRNITKPETEQEKAQRSREDAIKKSQEQQKDRNFLAEAVEAGASKEDKSYLQEAQDTRTPERKEKDQHTEQYHHYLNEAERLTVEKTNSEGLSVKEQDDLDRRIKEAKDKAEEERQAAGIKSAKEKWTDMQYDPNNWTGEDEWAFLQPDEQAENLVGGWGRQYAGGATMAAGTGLQWFDQASDDMVRYEYDQEHGEGAYDRAIAGKNVNQIGDLGDKLWDTGVNLQETGQQMWESGTADMSDTGKQIANVAKTGMDVLGDIGLNAIAPGMGTMRMYMGAAGGAAYEQSQRENDDIDSRMVAAMKGGLSAYLSNKLVGGMDAVYGESVLGKQIHEMFGQASPEVQKVLKPLLNTEGIEEGLEDILNWAADEILGLETGQPLDWNEVKQDAFIGYVLGVLTNGLAGGMKIDNKMLHNIEKGGMEFVALAEQLGDTNAAMDQAAEIGKQNTKDQVVLQYKPEAETTTEPLAPAAQPKQDSTGTAWTGDWNSWVDAALSGGALSDTDVDTIYNRPAARQAFEEITGVSLEGMTEEEAKATIGMAAGTTNKGPVSVPATEPVVNNEGTTETGANPEAEAAPENQGNPEAEQPGNTNIPPEGNEAENQSESNENSGQNETNRQGQNTTQQSRPLNEEPPEQRREKISQYFTNTLTESGRAEGLDPITYNPTSEAESLTNAAMKLKADQLGVLGNLMKSPAWDGEMVDSAWMIENELFKQWEKTGDREALDAWKRIETHKISQTAKGLQAVAKQSRPGAAGVLNAIMNEIADVRKANAEAKARGNTKAVVSEEVLTKAEEKANDVARRMAHLENMIDDAVASGISEADAKSAVKNEYLDLIDEINVFRHTGLMQDAGKNAAMRKGAEKLNTKFRKMLSDEGMDYIMRFAACDAAGISEDIHYEGKQDFWKRLNTWQKLAQLTGTGTWLRNGVGNGSFGIVDVLSADNPVTWIADALMSKKTGKRSSGVETGILNKSARDAAAHALHRSILEVAANIDLAGDTDPTKYDMGRTRTYDPDGNALERIGSRWEQWNGYMLQSSDAWFKGMASGSAEAAIRNANKWGEDNLTDAERSSMKPADAEKLSQKRQAELDEVKQQIAEYRTFQNNGIAAKGANEVRDWLNKKGGEVGKIFGGNGWQQGQFGLGTALMPYTKVPTNLAVKSLEFSPAGMAKGLVEMAQVLNDPNATMAQQNKAVTDFGRGVTGTSLIALLAMGMKKAPWFKDWDNEDDKDVKAQNKAEGKSGMQLNLDMMLRSFKGDKNPTWQNGDRTLNIASMEPLNQLITTASLIAEQEDFTLKGASDAFFQSAHDSINNMPALQTLANIENTIRYTDTPDDLGQTLATTAASTVGNVAGGMLPAPIKHVAAVRDENVRDTSGNNQLERVVNQVKSGIPGLRETLPVKTDAFGNEMKAGDFPTRFANQYDSFKHSQVNQSDVSREIERIREATDEVLVPSRNGPSSVTFGSGADKETVKLTNAEKQDYKNALGQDYERAVSELMQNPVYQIADDQTKAAMLKEIESLSKDTAKMNLAEEHDIEYESQYADVRELEDPIAFLTAKTGFNEAKSGENYNAVDALLGTIRDGRLSDKELDYYEAHMPGFKKLYAMQDSGVKSERVMAFANNLKARYEGEKRTAPRGADYIREAGSGKYSDKEADAFMNYAPDVSQETVDRYKDQIQFQLDKAGMGNAYETVWNSIEQVVNGELDNAKFKKWVDKNVPLQQRQEIKDICSNYAKDRHESGKTVSGIYNAMREVGYTPEQALQFYDMIDTNYNGYYTKKELDKACQKAFGNTSYGKKVRSLLKQYIGK